MTPCQVTVLITTVANIIAEDKSKREIEILAALLIQLAYTLETLSILQGEEEELTKKATDL